MIDKIVTANGEHKSLGKAQKMLRKLAEISVSVPLIEDYTREIGDELSGHLRQQAEAHAAGTLASEHGFKLHFGNSDVDPKRTLKPNDA